MSTKSTLLPWFGGMISKFCSGLFHGSIVGGGTSTGIAVSGATDNLHLLIKGTLIAAVIGGVKDVAFYVNANPMPNIFAQPVIAPLPGPVAPPTVSDQPSTLISPTSSK